jgi:hypothetical protein
MEEHPCHNPFRTRVPHVPLVQYLHREECQATAAGMQPQQEIGKVPKFGTFPISL